MRARFSAQRDADLVRLRLRLRCAGGTAGVPAGTPGREAGQSGRGLVGIARAPLGGQWDCIVVRVGAELVEEQRGGIDRLRLAVLIDGGVIDSVVAIVVGVGGVGRVHGLALVETHRHMLRPVVTRGPQTS